jgi:hypothetical protein
MRIAPLKRIATACLAVAALAGCQRNVDGISLRQRTETIGFAGRSDESTQYWTADRMILDDSRTRLIVDFDAQTLTSIDKDKKVYLVMSFDQMKARVDARHRQTEADTAHYPPEAKVQLEKMGELPGDLVAQVEVESTGRHETIAGFETEEYSFKGSMAVGSLWVTPELTLPLGAAQRAAYRKSMDGMSAPNMQLALAMLELDRIPLRTIMRPAADPERASATNEVVEVTRTGPPKDLLTIPSDFSPAPTPQGGNGEKQG